jgi:hypothetical protein
MMPELTYLVLLTGLSLVQGAASQLPKLEMEGAVALFAILGLVAIAAAIIYGFFLVRWYVVLGLLVLAIVIDVIFVHLRLAPRHPVPRLVYGYGVALIALVLHVLSQPNVVLDVIRAAAKSVKAA